MGWVEERVRSESLEGRIKSSRSRLLGKEIFDS